MATWPMIVKMRSCLPWCVASLMTLTGCFSTAEKPAELECVGDVSFTRCEGGERLVACVEGELSVTFCEQGCASDSSDASCLSSGELQDASARTFDTGIDVSSTDENEDTGSPSPDSLLPTEPSGCAVNNGGCDPLVVCAEGPDGVVCGPCPLGYSGDAQEGCVDLCEACDAPTPLCGEGGGCVACLGDDDCGPGRSCSQDTNTCTGCDVFGQTGCADNQVCTVVYAADGQSYEGVCSDGASPPGLPGEFCNPIQCRHGAICQQDVDQLYRCRALCAKEAAPLAMGSCPLGEACIPLTSEQGGVIVEEAMGSCAIPCEPFDPDMACPDGYWCTPDLLDPALERPGTCVASVGGVQADESCAPLFTDPVGTTCAEGMICLYGECKTFCDSDLAPCTKGGCMDFGSSDESYVAFSLCQVGCDYDGGIPCEDASEVCIPATYLDDGAEGGACINAPTDPNWPYDEFETCSQTTGLCAPFSYCIDWTGFPGSTGYQCYELCRFSEGAKNTTNHPDCTRKTALCEDILGPGLGTTTFGVCGNDIPGGG